MNPSGANLALPFDSDEELARMISLGQLYMQMDRGSRDGEIGWLEEDGLTRVHSGEGSGIAKGKGSGESKRSWGEITA